MSFVDLKATGEDISDMSFAYDGLNSKIKKYTASILVEEAHSLVRLANRIPWGQMSEIALVDLKKTTAKGFWNVGRRLFLRVHLGIYVLQARLKKVDEQIIQEVSENVVYQAFCGASIIKGWKCPHPKKIQEFRSRLSPETQMKLNECIHCCPVRLNKAKRQLVHGWMPRNSGKGT